MPRDPSPLPVPKPARPRPKRAFSLQTYFAMANGSAQSPSPPDRPKGAVVLTLADTALNSHALQGLVNRLRQLRPDLSAFSACNIACGPDVLPLPAERMADCAAFARALRPDVVIFAGTEGRPALIDALVQEGARLIGLNLGLEGLRTPAPRWMPDPGPATLALFDTLFVDTTDTRRRYRRQGVERPEIHVAGRLLDSQPPLDCSDALHEEVASVLAGRPVWLAAHLHVEEAHSVLMAHRQASRLAHRLLLLAIPDTPEAAETLRHAANSLQLRTCEWEDGDLPNENTQVLIAEGPQELGLWYRLAPLAFLGRSLVANGGGCDPFEAASLGAAILYGPNVGGHLAAYSALVKAGAARIVRDPDSLASALSNLIAPDQAAAMAHAGWEVVSEGAALADAVIDEIIDHLDTVARS